MELKDWVLKDWVVEQRAISHLLLWFAKETLQTWILTCYFYLNWWKSVSISLSQPSLVFNVDRKTLQAHNLMTTCDEAHVPHATFYVSSKKVTRNEEHRKVSCDTDFQAD